MFVSRARYNQLDRQLQREVKRRQDAERKLDEKATAILRMQGRVQQHREQHPDAPLPYPAPLTGDGELRRQLGLVKDARAGLERHLAVLQAVNMRCTCGAGEQA